MTGVALLATGCGTGDSSNYAVPYIGSAASGTVNLASSVLELSPAAATVPLGGTAQLVASGGVYPYTFTLLSGGGGVDASGLYTAPTTATSAVVRVQDATGTTATATIQVSTSAATGATGILTFPPSTAQTASNGGYIMGSAASNDVYSGWPASNAIDLNATTAYSSNSFAGAVNDRDTYLAAWIGTPPQTVGHVIMTARMIEGIPIGFPQSYEIWITDSADSTWVSQGVYTSQPDINGNVVLPLPSSTKSYGVLIAPINLGVNATGSFYYFELAELQLSQ